MSIKKKLLVVGGRFEGRTEIVFWLASENPAKYVHEWLWPGECFVTNIKVEGNEVELAIFDIYCQDDYDRLRPFNYSDTDVVMLVFSVVEPKSFDVLAKKWIPEVKHFCPNTPVILIGYKTDLRNDPNTLLQLTEIKQEPISLQMGEQLAYNIKAEIYIESDSYGTEVKGILEEVVRASFHGEINKFHYAKPETLQMILVGDTNVGKSSILKQFRNNQRSNVFGQHLLRLTDFAWTLALIEIDGEEYKLYIWDGLCGSNASLPETDQVFLPKKQSVDVFIVTFSVIEPDSYCSVEKKWIPALKRYCPKATIVLVGNKTNFRNNSKQHITTEMGEDLARRINAAMYLECSSSDGKKWNTLSRELFGLHFVEPKKGNRNLGFTDSCIENGFNSLTL